jgi:hypothetical protein
VIEIKMGLSRRRFLDVVPNPVDDLSGSIGSAYGQVQGLADLCQSAFKFDPVSASNFAPLDRRVLVVARLPGDTPSANLRETPREARMTVKTLALLLALTTPSAVHAQTYPAKPVRIIVPLAAGGLADTLARVVAQRVGEVSGQNAVVENRPGGAGAIGMEAAVRSPPDGYRLFLGGQGTNKFDRILNDDRQVGFFAAQHLPRLHDKCGGWIASINEKFLHTSIGVIEKQFARCRFAIAARAARFLIISFDAPGDFKVRDEANVRPINPHTEGVGRDDDIALPLHE